MDTKTDHIEIDEWGFLEQLKGIFTSSTINITTKRNNNIKY